MENTRDKTFTVPIESVRQPPTIEIAQEPYYLTEVNFYHLTKGKSKAAHIGLASFLTSVGYLLVLIAKITAIELFNKTIKIEEWEWLVVLIGSIIGIVVYFVSSIFFCDSTKLKKEIKLHFENSPKARQLRGAKK
ncbi:MAG: hypothetical protein GY928_32720 [Colwellia sp.]|nr:hypothetical protein [Colwellia sp.]